MALKLNGTITAAPITADAAPNTTEPPANRVTTTPLKDGQVFGGAFDMLLFLADGTTLDITAWVKVPGLGDSWHALGSAATVTALAVAFIEGVPPDSEIFLQVTAPVGNPTSFGFACV